MRFGPFWPTTGIAPGGHCDLQKVAGLRSINYGAWKNLQVSGVESKCTEWGGFKQTLFILIEW